MESADNNNLMILCFGAASMYALNVINQEKKTKKRRVWVHPWLKRRDQNGYCVKLLNDLRIESPELYNNFLRMKAEDFEHLLGLVAPIITKADTPMRSAISASNRLMITIRYLATGDSYRSLQHIFRIPHNTISTIVPEVCAAIYQALLADSMKLPSNDFEWRQTAHDFNLLWNFPNCIGSLDAKHVVMNAPPKSSSDFYNYKGSHSIVLMGLADAEYKFLYIDVGSNGSITNGDVFRRTSLCKGLVENKLNLPQRTPLPERDIPVPYLMVGDDTFASNNRLLKPFSQRNLSAIERIFNYRHSRVRRVIENAFGILSARFRVLRRPIVLNPEKIRLLTVACCALHNYLIIRKSNYITPNLVDREACDGTVIPGEWRDNRDRNIFFGLEAHQYHMSNDANEVRNEFADYFVGEGELSFQYNHI